MQKIFHYSRDDGRYMPLSSEAPEELGIACESPLEPGVYLIPAFATTIEPPQDIDKWPVFKGGSWELVDFVTSKTLYSTEDGCMIAPALGKTIDDLGATDKAKPEQGERELVEFENDDWVIKVDLRGVTYWMPDGSQHIITEVGVDRPDGALDEAPLPPPPTIEEVKLVQASLLSAACEAAITGDFSSSALGEVFKYPSKQTDQINLNCKVTASLVPTLPSDWTTMQLCCDAAGVWSFRVHTAAQIRQVLVDMGFAITQCLMINDQLQKVISQATEEGAVKAVVWPI